MTKQCDSCMHKGVCAYSECYEKAMNAVEEVGYIRSCSNVFSCKIECTHYKEELTARARAIPISKPSLLVNKEEAIANLKAWYNNDEF